MIKRMLIMLVAVIVVLGGILGFKYMNAVMTQKFLSNMPIPAQTVSSAKAETQEWQPSDKAVGSVRAVNGSDLSSEVAGIVESLSFESGSDVEKGAVLVQLRAADDIAKLHELEAAEKLADITLQRDLKQVKSQAISQATVDADTATLDSDKAQVANQQAIIDKKTIKAPFAGRLGIRAVDVGQYLAAGTMIVTLQQLDPIYVDFNLPEQSLTHVEIGQKVAVKTDALPNMKFEGEISAINSKIDEATRNIQVRATFKNADHKLLPGMFVGVTIDTGAPVRYITLPQTVVTYNPYGNTIYLVDRSDTSKVVARQTFITVGQTRGDQIAVLSGIQEGDEVVTSGQIKLRNGAPIQINNEIEPSNDPNPKPQDK